MSIEEILFRPSNKFLALTNHAYMFNPKSHVCYFWWRIFNWYLRPLLLLFIYGKIWFLAWLTFSLLYIGSFKSFLSCFWLIFKFILTLKSTFTFMFFSSDIILLSFFILTFYAKPPVSFSPFKFVWDFFLKNASIYTRSFWLTWLNCFSPTDPP